MARHPSTQRVLCFPLVMLAVVTCGMSKCTVFETEYRNRYAYTVHPGVSVDEAQLRVHSMIPTAHILNPELHAVLFSNEHQQSTLQLVAFEAAQSALLGPTYNVANVSAACVLQVAALSASQVAITVADPTNGATELTEVSFTIDRVLRTVEMNSGIVCTPNANGGTTVTATLPKGIAAGSSLTGSCQQ